MPTYNWSCEKCSHAQEAYVHSFKDLLNCPSCDEPMVRVWSLGVRHVGASIFPFVTKNITGKPVEVTSQSHLDRLCKENGVTHRPDVAWIEKEYQGVDFATGKQKYKESSGVGMPGCWQ